MEKGLNDTFPKDKKYTIIVKNDSVKTKLYSEDYTRTYNALLKGMSERKMRKAVQAVGSFWYTAWVNAGKPDINNFDKAKLSDETKMRLKDEENRWMAGK